jgi:hypothetical protein
MPASRGEQPPLSRHCGTVVEASALHAKRDFRRRGSRRGGKAGVRIGDPKQLFCIHSATQAFANGRLSLVLLVHCASDNGYASVSRRAHGMCVVASSEVPV